jgi:hypothetical protein
MNRLKPTLVLQSGLLIGCTTLCTLVLLGVLCYFNIEKRCKDLRGSAYGALARDIAAAVENGLGFGLRCSELRTIPDILRRSKGKDTDIETISVLNTDGSLVFTTDATRFAAIPVSEGIIHPTRDGPITVTLSGGKAVLYLPLLNGYAVREGILQLSYKAIDINHMNRVKQSMAIIIACISLITLCLAGLLVKPLLRPVTATMNAMTDALKGNDDESPYDVSDVIAFRKQSKELITEMNTAVAQCTAEDHGK